VFEGWRAGAIHKCFNGCATLAAPRRAEGLVLRFLRGSSGSSKAR